MFYFFCVAWQYMKKNPGRTIYSILGIMVTFILSFSIFTAGYSCWDYAGLVEERVDQAQLFVEEDWTNDEDEVVGITQEQIEQVKKLAQCTEVKTLFLWSMETVIEEDEELEMLTTDDLEPGVAYEIEIGLKDVSDLQASAQSLQEQTGLNMGVKPSAEEYYGQGDATWREAYHAIVVIIAVIFSFFSVMILRNTMMISAVERMQDYGLWRCVGMSGKQLYYQLAVEGFLISMFAAAGGIGAGFGLLKAVAAWLNSIIDLEVPFDFYFYPKAVLYTTLLCVGATLYALLEPARQVGTLSPIEAIHNNIVLQGRKGKLQNRIQYHQSRLWAKVFGVSGEYAYKNMRRNRGRSLSLFFSLMFCVILIGLAQSGVGSLYASVKNVYQGKGVEYLELIVPDSEGYDEELVSRIEEEVNQLESVQKAKRLISKTEVFSFDPTLQEYINIRKDYICEHYAYDQEQISRFKDYLLEGEIDYTAMTEQKGVLLCDMQYNVSSRETDFNQMDVRKTEYQVGDQITALSGEGKKRAYSLYEQALHQVAEKAGIAATRDEAWEKIEENGEMEGGEKSDDDIFSLDELPKGAKGYEKYQKQMLDIIAKQGVSIQPEEISAMHTDPETGESTGVECIETILDVLEQREYDRGAKETYIIQGIVSEDPVNGGMTMVNLPDSITLIHSRDAVTANIDEEDWSWVIEVKRDPLDIRNKELNKYCQEQTTGVGLSSKYIYEWSEDYDITEYLEMLETMNIVRVIIVLIISGIIIICLIQIFNTLCANIALRQKEFWLYGVVGMSRRQKYRMILLEHGVATVAAIIFGYFAAWGFSWYLIDDLLNQNGVIHYEWPWGIMLTVCGGILFLIELVSVLGIRSTAEK